MKYDFIIIGNGIAGFTAAKNLSKSNKKILIISRENENTYYRTKLSEFISEDFTEKELFVTKSLRYEENNVDVLLGANAIKIDKENKKIILSDKREFEYDKLLLATGASAFIPPIEGINAKGVFAIRTIDDLNNFKEYLKTSKKVAVIGGGILGLEAAFSIKKANKEVLVIEGAPEILSRQLDTELSRKLEKELNKIGIETKKGTNTSKILSENGKVIGIEFDDTTQIEADVVLVQTGVRSNLDLAKNSSIKTDRGILANEELKVLDEEDIFTAGDCAQINNITMGLWTASMDMGKIASSNMLGENLKYETPKLFTFLNIGNIKVFSAGENKDVIEEKREDENGIYKIFKRDGKIVGGILWNNTKYMNDLKKVVFEGKDLKETKLNEIFS
ncbi:MAG: FAD-dependent oxidoreductase [Peptoniphilaceae bacterium]|nr:FAD-dependent oxidoreductase [Peptoniphilaceae bacterium]MDY3738596.1 FAD-dependent oxidoreductase [Peptoniphilaceae bacterium]